MDSSIDALPQWFGAGAPPLQLDIGSHRGVFLAAMAARFPGTNFLGIERLSARVDRSNAKFARLGLANAHCLRGGGLEVLKELPTGCAEGVHVLFPDPWPKRRHAPRRLVGPAFLEECARILAPGGFLRIGTDDEPYARAIRLALAACPALAPGWQPPEFPPTEFERKFLAAGVAPHWVTALRKDDGSMGLTPGNARSSG